MGALEIVLLVAFGATAATWAGLAIKQAVTNYKIKKARKNPPHHPAGEIFSYEEFSKTRSTQAKATAPKHQESQVQREVTRTEETTISQTRRR